MKRFRNVGLNADWNCPAYHMGPSDEPNQTSGDYYIVDDKRDSLDPFTLVRRFYVADDNDNIVDVAENHDFDELVSQYKREVE